MELYITALKGVIEQSGFVALTSGNIRRVLGDAEDVADGRDEPRRH